MAAAQVAKEVFRTAYEVSPILLSGGIASSIPGGIMPIVTLTDGIGIVNGLLQGNGFNQDSFSSAFFPGSGSTLLAQDVSDYPFFNQATAANAVVQRPNQISMNMVRPANTIGNTYPAKLMTFTALKLALEKHNQIGGTYIVLTPAYIYTGCLLRALTDISSFSEQNKQVQSTWAFSFEQPLLTISQLDAVMGNLMNKFDSGVPQSVDPSSGTYGWSSQQEYRDGLF